MKTFKITVSEGELVALIYYHNRIMRDYIEVGDVPLIETSERIHNLTKRLNKDTPEVEGTIDPPQATAAKDEQPVSW